MLKLVYACLAFAAIALAILFAVAFEQKDFFRGTTVDMLRAIQNPGEVLAADRRGAVTQTGNGVVAGYRRGSGERVWQLRINRFPDAEAGRHWSDPALDASARCAGECPSAFVATPTGYEAVGGASKQVADQLNRDGAGLLATLGEAEVLANAGGRLVHYRGAEHDRLPISNPSVVEASADTDRIVIGSRDGEDGVLSRFERSSAGWQEVAQPLRSAALRNLCISEDGERVGAVAERAMTLDFEQDGADPLGGEVTGGRCQIDASGSTFAVNPASPNSPIRVQRYDADGAPAWREELVSLRLISPSGSPLIAAQSANFRLTLIDAVSGKREELRTEVFSPLVGSDGAVVDSSRSGLPRWLVAED